MKKPFLATIILAAVFHIALTDGAARSSDTAANATAFLRINIKSGYLTIREIPSTKGKPVGVFYMGDDCALAFGETRKDASRTWIKVFNPYLRATGWVDSQFTAPSTSNCDFERFLYETKGHADWVFDRMIFPLVISSPNVEEKPSEYSKDDVLSSKKNLYDAPYYYLQLLDDAGIRKFWAERDGCAKYELLENKKFDVNSYKLYVVSKTDAAASLTFSCNEMYPEFRFKKTDDGFVMDGIVDGGS